MPRFFHIPRDPRIGGEQTGDVLPQADLAGAQGPPHQGGRQIGAAAPQGGDVRLRRDPLEAGHDGDLPLVHVLAETGRIDAQDAGAAVAAVRHDPGLGAGKAACGHPQLSQGHCKEGA